MLKEAPAVNQKRVNRSKQLRCALMKKLSFGEAKSVTFGAQFFNLFNHPQFTGGYLSDVTPYSTAAISRNFLVPGNAAFSTEALKGLVPLPHSAIRCSGERGS
jgi:hypothetical protein